MVSTQSAINSREGREYFIPICPIAMPSSTPMVLNSKGTPPAAEKQPAAINSLLYVVRASTSAFIPESSGPQE